MLVFASGNWDRLGTHLMVGCFLHFRLCVQVLKLEEDYSSLIFHRNYKTDSHWVDVFLWFGLRLIYHHSAKSLFLLWVGVCVDKHWNNTYQEMRRVCI